MASMPALPEAQFYERLSGRKVRRAHRTNADAAIGEHVMLRQIVASALATGCRAIAECVMSRKE